VGGGGELTLYLKRHREVRGALTAGQVRDVLRRWAAAARAVLRAWAASERAGQGTLPGRA
jgi:hypothetical protein